MASLTYTGDSGIMTHIGILIRSINEIPDLISEWDDRETEIQDVYEAGNQEVAASSLIRTVDGIQSSLATIRTSLSAISDARLVDYSTVIAILLIPDASIASVLKNMIYHMISDAATINKSTVTLGTVTAGGSNVGTGTILLDKVLDGFNSPINGAVSHPAYNGVNSEFSVNDTLTAVCDKDSYTDRTVDGGETFNWYGSPALSQKWATGTEGAGQGPSLTSAQSGTVLTNGTFETFSTTNVADSWTYSLGVVTTNFAKTSVAGEFYRGSSGLKIIGDSATATLTVKQSVSSSQVTPLRRYCCAFRYKASATDTGRTFTVKMTGTSYTEGSTEKYTIAGASLPTSWTLAYYFFNMPAVIPSDFALSVTYSSTPTKNIFLDDLMLAPVLYFNGICGISVPGVTPFTRGDSFTMTVANDQSGRFQEYFRRGYSVQLPSSASSSISDGLAS